jgi:hypothetical protein
MPQSEFFSSSAISIPIPTGFLSTVLSSAILLLSLNSLLLLLLHGLPRGFEAHAY